MKIIWSEEDLIDSFTLSIDELNLFANKSLPQKIGFAVLLKYIQYEGKFPLSKNEIPIVVIKHIAKQIEVSVEKFSDYQLKGRTVEDHRSTIRKFIGFNKWSSQYTNDLSEWIQTIFFPDHFKGDYLKERILKHLHNLKIEPPKKNVLERIINSAVNEWEIKTFKCISDKISLKSKSEMDLILDNEKNFIEENDNTPLRQLKSDPGNVSLKSILAETAKLECIRKVNLPQNLFKGLPYKILKKYRDRVITEPAREIRRHPNNIRYALFSIFLYIRGREITDDLLDLLIQLVHNIGTNSEKAITKEIISEIIKINNKEELLYKIAVASAEKPQSTVEDVIFPAVGEQTIHDIIREYKQKGSYTYKINTRMRSSYRSHYRRMLPAILKALDFYSNNQEYRPIIDAIQILRKYLDSRIQFYPEDEDIPIEGVVPNAWESLLFENNGEKKQLNRITYEICVLEALREKLRCKEIWTEGADRYRNPDEDLPKDFDLKRGEYYDELKLPLDVEIYIASLQKAMNNALKAFNDGYPNNDLVEFIKKKKKNQIKLSPSEAQPDPPNLHRLKSAIKKEWDIVNLLDILKETDLRINFTRHFKSVAQREIIDWPALQKRLLLVLYAMGTNTGVKRIVAGDHGEKYHELMYVLRRFVTKEHLKQANADVSNAIFEARLPHIWGEATTACASDSKQFRAWDQNLLTEYHVRYGGRGVMIYWHVEKGSSCIYSQLKKCSSSEAATMIEGVMRHCTEMAVKKQYVDTHGQSYVAFAFCHLLGFKLLPRFKSIHSKKLYRPYTGKPEAYENLQPILTRPINWELIRQQYDQMIKFATAIRLGTADTESILRRFTRDNLKHPTYQALLELGKVIRTIFLCNYLNSEALRIEIHEGLNVIERWNGVNDFIFFGKSGEISTNKKYSQELLVLSLHLLQNCLVYINTLLIQQILNDPEHMKYMTDEDFRALTPLIFNYVNPYGSFNLDMKSRIPNIPEFKEAA